MGFRPVHDLCDACAVLTQMSYKAACAGSRSLTHVCNNNINNNNNNSNLLLIAHTPQEDARMRITIDQNIKNLIHV